MKRFNKCIGLVTAAALFATSIPATPLTTQVFAEEVGSTSANTVDAVVKLKPEEASVFNDTDGDGLGEFQGWGTSLCWWANRLGYDETLTELSTKYFFSDEGLDMNIGRYNVGGGDCVGDVQKVSANPNAVFYDLETEGYMPTYAGSSMTIGNITKLASSTYKVTDADFGFNKGDKVGNFKCIGYVNALDGAVGTGDNLNFTVNAKEAGNYTVKLLFTLDGKIDRDVAIRVNDDTATEQVVDSVYLNENIVASSGSDVGKSQHLVLVTFENVALKAGNNKVLVAGKAGWTLDFVKMAVIKSGEEGVIPEADEFLHEEHIKRSDSAIPGYATDVTKIDTTKKTIEEYEDEFARVDEECGYAWNYDWDADANQINIVKAAMEKSGDEFIAEAFSNSPPYFMTNSGCSSGATDASKDNLREDSYQAFAKYMSDVIVHWANNGIVFQSVTPMNEPYTSYWGAYSNKQEGCHFDQGDSQSAIIVALHDELMSQLDNITDASAREAIENIIFSGTDETSIDTQITSYNALSDAAQDIITRIDTHTYSGSKRSELRALAETEGKNLWMSEVDGAFTAGTNAGEMSAALGFGERIITDVAGLKSTAWILWNAVDMHVDANNEFDADSIDDLAIDGSKPVDFNSGYWGIAVGDHNNKEVVLTKKYYAYGQFSRYIRPGYTIIGSTGNTLAAYDPKGDKVVVVAINTAGEDKKWRFNLANFTSMGDEVTAIRTSGDVATGENWADVSASVNAVADTENKTFSADLKANSITTFIVEGVDYDASAVVEKEIEEIALSKDMVTGSTPWNNGSDVASNVVDGNLSTFFDGVNNGWLQIDLGAETELTAVAYAPRNSYAGRCKDASFYGSDDGETWTKLYTIGSTPASGTLTYVYADEFLSADTSYRYIKYSVPAGEDYNCNIAEIKLYTVVEHCEDTTELAAFVSELKSKMEGRQFTDDTKAAFDKAVSDAEALIEEETTDTAKILAAEKALIAAYDALKEIYTYDSFTGVAGDQLFDNNGNLVQAHGGQIQQLTYDMNEDGDTTDAEDTFWFWVGEDKTNDYRPCPGIKGYMSYDLYNWIDMGNILKTVPDWETFTTDDYFTELYGSAGVTEESENYDELFAVYGDIWAPNSSTSGCVIERPKMLYNEKNDNYVIWFHADGQVPGGTGSNYAKAKAGVAVSDSPFGPYKLLGSYLLNYDENADHGFDSTNATAEDPTGGGGHVRDMNLFKDSDGTGYVLYSSDGNQTMHIAQLNEDYTGVKEPNINNDAENEYFSRNFIGESREAPAMFKYKDLYYMITSGCTGWSPNPAKYAVAEHPLGPWTMVGDPCTDEGASTTYNTQSTCVFPVDAEKGKFIYMGDRWYNEESPIGGVLRNSRYIWLPVEFTGEGEIALRSYSDWTLELLDNLAPMEVVTELPEVVASASELEEVLPDTLELRTVSDNSVAEYEVTWSGIPATERAVGTYDLTATLKSGRVINHEVQIVDAKTIYAFDCSADTSEYVDAAKASLGNKLRNSAADQAYSSKTHAGYTGTLEVDFGIKTAGMDIWSRGYWAEGSKTLDYAFDLEAGTYTVATGYQEWWNTARPTKITVSTPSGTVATKTFTLAKTDTALQQNVSFTLEKGAKVTVKVSKTGTYDPVLSWIMVMQDEQTGVLADKAELDTAIDEMKEVEDSGYTSASWDAFMAAIEEAESVQSDVLATDEDIAEAVRALEEAKAQLKTVKVLLEEGIAEYTVPSQDESKYTVESWAVYVVLLEEAKALLAEENLTEAQVTTVLNNLAEGKAMLVLKDAASKPTTPQAKSVQTISGTKAYTVAYAKKAFALDAKVTKGDGKLSYASSNAKVATVSADGKVSMKGIGVCTITVTAAETASYKKASFDVTIQITPAKMNVKSAKATGGKKLKVTWKKDSKVTGYEIQYSTDKKFKKGVKKATVKKAKTTSTTLKKLKKGKKYYVRIRSYKTVKVNGKTMKLYSAWSKAKKTAKIK